MARRVKWSYTHVFGKSKVRKTKTGNYIRLIYHPRKFWLRHDSTQMAYVLFDGNKRYSRVPYHELEFIYD